MACVLSVPALYTNQVKVDADLQINECKSFEFEWINVHHQHSGLSDNHRCANPFHLETSAGSSISCRMEITNGYSGSVIHAKCKRRTETGCDTDYKENHFNTENGVTNLFEIYNKTVVEQGKKCGVKRKTEVTESEDVYIPSKRVSPFLNTPKERKDERKKILKISIKKLKQLDDPEIFLRRTVLVNNFTKRLQSELQQENLRPKKRASNKRKPFNGYRAHNMICTTNTNLFDDPFLSGVYEKITDDMTETLLKNVLSETNEKTGKCDTGDRSNFSVMKVSNSRTCTLLNDVEDNSSQSSGCEGSGALKSSKECSLWTCLNDRTDVQEMSCDIYDELHLVREDVNIIAENFKEIYHNNCE